MSTVDTVKAQLQSLITKAKNVTGNDASDLTSQVDALIDGYGNGTPVQYSETFTVDSDISGTASTKVISGNSFIAEHINDNALFVVLVRQTTTMSDAYIHLIAASNSLCLIGGYFLTVYRTSNSTAIQNSNRVNYKLSSPTNGVYARIHADSNGDVYVHTYTPSNGNNPVRLKAGTYTLFYGLFG